MTHHQENYRLVVPIVATIVTGSLPCAYPLKYIPSDKIGPAGPSPTIPYHGGESPIPPDSRSSVHLPSVKR